MAASYGQQPAHGAAWARVQLVRGQSGAQHWAIDGQYPEARLTIGSAPDAGWQVQSVGVQPYHFELFWDGRSLWVSDTRRVGSVTLNGRPVGEWVQVRGRSEISFGSAGMQVETADAMTNEMASNPGEARRVTVAPGEGWNAASFGAPIAAGASSQPWDDSSLPGEATRVAAPPSESMGHGGHGGSGNWAEMDAESTRIAHEGAIPGLPPLSGAAPAHKPLSGPPPPMLRPRLGGGGPASMASAAAVAPPGRDMARTITADEMSHHLAAAHQIAQGVHDPAGTSPSVVVQSGYPQQQFAQGGFAQPQQGYGAPQQGFAPGGPGGGGPQSGFMAPPTFDQAHQDATAKPQGKKRVLPIRTLVLLAVTVLAAVGLILMAPGAEAPVAPPQPGAGTVPVALPQGGPVPQAGVPQPLPQAGVPQPLPQGGTPQPLPQGGTPQPLPQGGTPQAGVPQPLPQGGTPQPLPETGDPVAADSQPGAAEGTAGTAPTTPGGEVVPVVPVGPTPDRLAADLVITGRYADALPQYQQLAAAHPERPEYAQMVRILQQRLAGRCQGGVGPDGRPCTGR